MKDKIIEIITDNADENAANYFEMDHGAIEEAAEEIEAALIWHGPDEVPPKEIYVDDYSINVYDQDGTPFYYGYECGFWWNANTTKKQIPTKWRYPAPEKRK